MKPAVHLQTKTGLTFYRVIEKEFHQCKENQSLDAYRKVLHELLQESDNELTLFLDSDIMAKQHQMNDEDTIGWQYYKETADQYSVLNHFYHRKA
jgi:hypothetical protein